MIDKYKHSTVYQIYPRSFCDSDGDGVGDIKGIISKLDYIASLGVDVIWLSPVYKSPNDDNGYDISDYKAIQPEFGTMEDFDLLLSEAKARGISIIMDLVINHTSDEHEWFERAKAGEEKYRDYYVIKKGKNGKLPNNWGNFFAECPWEPFGDPKNEEYYLHLFSKKQPDLNWYNPEVYREVADIMRFWLDKGVAGFRCDVINVIFKQSFKDGKRSLALTGKEHYLSTDGCHNILAALRRDVLNNYETLTVGETVMVDLKEAADLTLPERGGLLLTTTETEILRQCRKNSQTVPSLPVSPASGISSPSTASSSMERNSATDTSTPPTAPATSQKTVSRSATSCSVSMTTCLRTR